MKKQINYIFYMLSLGGMLWLNTACDTLNVEPNNAVDANVAIVDSSSLASAVVGIYDGLQSNNYYGLRYMIYQDVYTDNLQHSGTFTTDQEVTNRRIQNSNLQIANTWATMYRTINLCNTVIARIESIQMTTLNKNHYIGEARLVRGLVYYDLLKVFGGVPLQLQPTVSTGEISELPRSTQAQVYEQVISDLSFAEANLTNLNPLAQRLYRGTVRAATALLSRVYLQRGNTGDYALAAQKATEALGAATALVTPYPDVFNNNVTAETIFTLTFNNNDQNGLAQASNPNTGGQKFYYRAGFYNDFETASLDEGDERFAVSAQIIRNRRSLIKYSNTATNDDHVPIVRLSEMFLNRAESNARLGGLAAAPSQQVIDDINAVRNRAGLVDAAPATNEEALDEILLQRRREFVGEGHRFADLKRYGIAQNLFAEGNEFRVLWPIPLTQIEVNPSLTQNPGY